MTLTHIQAPLSKAELSGHSKFSPCRDQRAKPAGSTVFMATAVHSLFKLRSAVVRLNASLHTRTSSHKLRERQTLRSIKRIKNF